jgi:hypothetical protein
MQCPNLSEIRIAGSDGRGRCDQAPPGLVTGVSPLARNSHHPTFVINCSFTIVWETQTFAVR